MKDKHDSEACFGFAVMSVYGFAAVQYFFDASEAEAWMSEQELYMISEERARDEMGATNMLKKHSNMERVVEDYADTIRQLGERSRKFLDEGHPDRCVNDHNTSVTELGSFPYINVCAKVLLLII